MTNPRAGVQLSGLCQVPGDLSIGAHGHGVDEFGSSRGSISLLGYQIGARFLGHRALALVLHGSVAVKCEASAAGRREASSHLNSGRRT
jgi:hypothetical protein